MIDHDDEQALRADWRCHDDGDGPEHWCEAGHWVDEDDHSKGWTGCCGYCGSWSIIGPDGTGIYDEEVRQWTTWATPSATGWACGWRSRASSPCSSTSWAREGSRSERHRTDHHRR